MEDVAASPPAIIVEDNIDPDGTQREMLSANDSVRPEDKMSHLASGANEKENGS